MAFFALLLGLINPELRVSPPKKYIYMISDYSLIFGVCSSEMVFRALPFLGYVQRRNCSTNQYLPPNKALKILTHYIFGPFKF